MSEPLPPLVVIVGPTAVGKTALALQLAESLAGEIVSADSRLVYQGLDIGTAKPTPAERDRIPHHLIDLVDPDQSFSLATYQDRAYAAIADITARGRLPFLVGGTGQYVWAVVEGWTIPRAGPDEALRARLFAEAEAHGVEALHARLSAVDPTAAAKIDARNVRRVVRALEVYELTGRPISHWQRRRPPPYRPLILGLTLPRPVLYSRINARVKHMVDQGLFEEVRGLMDQGYSLDSPAMSGLGYQQVGLYLRGEISREKAIELVKRGTRRFARHQRNWFKPGDSRIHWVPADQPTVFEDLLTQIRAWLAEPT